MKKNRFLVAGLLLSAMMLAACGGEPVAAEPPYVFCADGLTLSIGQPAREVIHALPLAGKVQTAVSCGTGGTEAVYPCHGYRVYTLADGQREAYICHIELTDDTHSTPEGVRIGTPRAEAEAAMTAAGHPDGIPVGEDGLRYPRGDMSLLLLFDAHGCVCVIRYTWDGR